MPEGKEILYSPWTERVQFMEQGPDVLCWSGEHYQMVAFAIGGLVFWIAGEKRRSAACVDTRLYALPRVMPTMHLRLTSPPLSTRPAVL